MTEFSGPPEPILEPDGEGGNVRKVAYIDRDDTRGGEPTVRTVELGTWICQRCETETPVGVQNGKLAQPTECDSCGRSGPYTHKAIGPDTAQAALRADGLWCPPTGVPDDLDRSPLWDGVREYIRKHWDAKESEIYEGLTAYALSTWFRPNLTFVPHLMLMGKTTGGKTRLLNTLKRVSYRAVVSASATPASMYRMIDAYDVSFFVSEYHGLDPDSRRELDNVVRAGQKRGEVVARAEPAGDGFEPKSFDPFSHIAIATQYEPDDDIVNRCIQVRSSPSQRDMPPTLDETQARVLRNRLLGVRYRVLDSDEWDDAEQAAYAYLADRDITGRTREKLLSLVTVAILWDKLDDLEPFVDEVVEQDKTAAADSEDARFVECVRDLAFEEVGNTVVIGDGNPFGDVEIPLEKVANRYESMTGVEKSSAWAGQLRSRHGLEKERKRDGTVIRDDELETKLKQLCREHNLAWEASDIHDPVREIDDQYRAECNECGKLRDMTHRHAVEGHHMCETCAGEYRQAA